jgi:hypothetical protein
MKNKTILFFDQEFSGLHKNTTLISLGIVSDCGKTFYCELNDFDRSQCDDWINKNVIANLFLKEGGNNFDVNNYRILGSKEDIKEALTIWLSQFEEVEMWSDCLAYDWVLFCDIFGGAFSIPKNVYYIPFDICSFFKVKGIDPDINREEYSGLKDGAIKHNSLWDALVIQACHDKLMQ